MQRAHTLKLTCLLVLLVVGVGVIGKVEAAPRGPEYSAVISFPNGCLANGVLGEITWKHTSKLEAVEAAFHITGPVGQPPPESRMALTKKDQKKGEMSLLLDISPDPNHGVWRVIASLYNENGMSLGEWFSVQVSCNL